MPTIAEHIAARNDVDLRARFVAAAERAGIDSPAFWVDSQLGRLVNVDIGSTTVADVHAYAVGSYVPTPRPGEDATKVTDLHLEAAVAAVVGEQAGA